MSQSDAMNDIDPRQFDPAEVAAKDEALCLPTALDALNASEADREAAASLAMSSLPPALARYVDLLCLDQGIDLMAEARRFERGIIERAFELTKGNQKRAAKLLGLQSSTLHAKIKKYGLNVSRRKNARR
jgi:DNA-binding NtrC family response regulator